MGARRRMILLPQRPDVRRQYVLLLKADIRQYVAAKQNWHSDAEWFCKGASERLLLQIPLQCR